MKRRAFLALFAALLLISIACLLRPVTRVHREEGSGAQFPSAQGTRTPALTAGAIHPALRGTDGELPLLCTGTPAPSTTPVLPITRSPAPVTPLQPTAPHAPTPTLAAPTLLVWPYLGETTTTSVTIAWATDRAADGEVRYGTDGAYAHVLSATQQVYDGVHWYAATLSGLTAGTRYYYRVCAGGYDLTPWSEVAFTTAPADAASRLTFAVLGDSRPASEVTLQPSRAARELAAELGRHAFDLALLTGDMVGSGGICRGEESAWKQYLQQYLALYRESLGHVPFYPCLGNHELNGGNCGYQGYREVYFLPRNAPAGDEEEYYSFDWGNAHFLALDSNQAFGVGSRQYNWLVHDLQASQATWKFVFFHHPAYSSGHHGSTRAVQDALVPLFEQYGVDMVFNGHDHHYERTCPIRAGQCSSAQEGGVVYYVTGGGGAPLYKTGRDWFSAYSESRYHFILVEVEGSWLRVDAVDAQGNIFDTYVLEKARR